MGLAYFGESRLCAEYRSPAEGFSALATGPGKGPLLSVIAAAMRFPAMASATTGVGISAMAPAARMDIGAAVVAAIPATASSIDPCVVTKPSAPSVDDPSPSPWADATRHEKLCAGQNGGSNEYL